MRGSLPTPGLVVGPRVIDCVELTGGRSQLERNAGQALGSFPGCIGAPAGRGGVLCS